MQSHTVQHNMHGTGRIPALNNKIQLIKHPKPTIYGCLVAVICFQHSISSQYIIPWFLFFIFYIPNMSKSHAAKSVSRMDTPNLFFTLGQHFFETNGMIVSLNSPCHFPTLTFPCCDINHSYYCWSTNPVYTDLNWCLLAPYILPMSVVFSKFLEELRSALQILPHRNWF